ncbi:hypothetical protein KSP40_PGU005235 [Platanthera guangdongensis]|uniref:Uncharacterized protein n=1 Tax=Platanthera guangdongensis TaxID=2320717 RepID=A0ABR2MPW6_9ASPA
MTHIHNIAQVAMNAKIRANAFAAYGALCEYDTSTQHHAFLEQAIAALCTKRRKGFSGASYCNELVAFAKTLPYPSSYSSVIASKPPFHQSHTLSCFKTKMFDMRAIMSFD